MDWREHIVVDPAVLVGKPVVKGTRISVELLLDRFADGWSYDEVLAAYPHLSRISIFISDPAPSGLNAVDRDHQLAGASLHRPHLPHQVAALWHRITRTRDARAYDDAGELR